MKCNGRRSYENGIRFQSSQKNYENLNLTKQDFAEFASSVYLDSPQKSTVVLSDEEKKKSLFIIVLC